MALGDNALRGRGAGRLQAGTGISISPPSNARDSHVQVADDDVNLEGPIIAKALRDITPGSHTSQLICMNFLGVCGYPDIFPPRGHAFPSEKPENSTRPDPSGKDPIKIVHYSDVDQLYVPRSSANCTKPICCR